ncbi:MAG: glycosyltransferase family 2 protein [Ruminococcaceae bacterium]|nr:glycosyltransferase family 2 protein [Oscillospiraceae bacterium]
MRGIVLLPAYKPDKELIKLVDCLKEQFKLIVVDDGSGEEYRPIFEAVSPYATVLHHQENRGKGAALKTGIAYIQDNCTNDFSYFITADADGQHLVSDIMKVADKLESNRRIVLSMRVFKGRIPFRSRFGNWLSSYVFTTLTGSYFQDNQSGLRGFAVSECPWLLKVRGDRYDYEINVLYHAKKQNIPIHTVRIKAVYIDGNKSSHFDPVKDTLRIYKQLFYSARGTFLALALTEVLLLISTLTINWEYLFFTLPTIGIVSVGFNIFYCVSISMRQFAFRDVGPMILRAGLRYSIYILCAWLSSIYLPWMPVFVSLNIIMVLQSILENQTILLLTLLTKKERNPKVA